MILLLNGAFGIGKSTVARVLAERVPNCAVFNPELIGWVLQRCASVTGKPSGDFQDFRLWRQLTVAGLRTMSLRYQNLVVPMAFSNANYLNDIRAGIQQFDHQCVHCCLVAPLEIVQERLKQRGADPKRNPWEFRRAAECCVAHADAAFANHVSAGNRSPDEIANELLSFSFGASQRAA